MEVGGENAEPNESEAPRRRSPSWVSRPRAASPVSVERGLVVATGRCEALRSYPGRPLGLREMRGSQNQREKAWRRDERSRMTV